MAQRLNAVLAQLDLGKTAAAELVAEGLMNRNWAVTTSGNERVFVKQVLDVGAEQARLQHAATMALAARGLPVCAPLAAADGRTLFGVDDALFAVYPWVIGLHVPGSEMTLAQAGALGAVLARMHAVFAGVMPAARTAMVMPVAELAKARQAIAAYAAMIGQRPERSAFDEFAVGQLARRGRLLDCAGHLRPEAASVWEPCGWAHGDFHDLNVLWDEQGRLAAVLDFDRLGLRPLAFELVRSATLMFGFGDQRGLDLDRVSAFVRGYRDLGALSDGQIRQAVRGLWWERVCDFWQLKRHYLRDDTSCDHLFASASALLWWWTEHRADVEEAVTSR